jgi:hypothetical protein
MLFVFSDKLKICIITNSNKSHPKMKLIKLKT